ncbi:hypothetical protein BCU36_025225 [Vibrio lentus]
MVVDPWGRVVAQLDQEPTGLKYEWSK